MYGLFTFIWLIFREHVGKYTVHGWHGYDNPSESWIILGRNPWGQVPDFAGPLQMPENTSVTGVKTPISGVVSILITLVGAQVVQFLIDFTSISYNFEWS